MQTFIKRPANAGRFTFDKYICQVAPAAPMKKLFLYIVAFAPLHHCMAQNNSDVNLLALASAKMGLFVCRYPCYINITIKDTFDVTMAMRERNIKISKTLLLQLLENIPLADTADWTSSELPGKILYGSMTEYISVRSVKADLGLTDKKKIRKYKGYVRRYNNSDASEKTLWYISRPVYDNSRQYALVATRHKCGYLCGSYSVNLFHNENNLWVDLGVIYMWVS